ncbi:MAG: hypothetical protein JSS28_07415 [Proteobacteria bacterium]|nr:hypothetical protein [Pseudomonadota bacterium]
MATNLTYQANFPVHPAAPAMRAPDPNAPLFASEDGSVAALSGQECIFLNKRTGATHVMTFQVLQAMDQCREFRTLDEHIARIESTISGLAGKREDVRRVLDSLIQRGLLVSDQNFLGRLDQVPAQSPAALRGVFIRACDRPEQLARLLASLVDYERRHRAGRRYIVLDDSSLPAHANEQRDSLREFARNTGCKVHYVGRAEAARLVERLGKSVPAAAREAPRLLLRDAHPHAQRFGGGRGWNLAMLLSAGARLALLDDDLLLPLRRPEYASAAGAGLDPNPLVRQAARFLPNMEQALAAGAEVDADPFELHLRACGNGLGAMLATEYPIQRSALRGINLGRLDLLSAAARIVSTQAASYGSSRSAFGLWLYQLDGESRAQFWHDRESYLRNCEAQFIVQGTPRAQVMAVAGFTPLTIDNSRLLPCSSPVGRGQDSLAGAVTRFCHPDAVSLALPEAIGHVQESSRKRSDRTLAAFVPHVNYFLRDFVQRQFGLFHAEDPGTRMRLLADVLRDLAGASARDRIAHLREYLGYTRADIIDRIQHQIEAAGDAPVYWQADARAIVQANAKAMLANAAPRLSDWTEDLDEAGCARALAEECELLAAGLEHWPALWRHAAEQGEKLLAP